jgi:hypothetical protein
MTRHTRSLTRLSYITALAALAAGCETEAQSSFEFTPPPYESFSVVAYALGAHCGSLDCHGDPLRNLRVYGIQGLRWSPSDVTGFGGTTDAEVEATFQSIVALEPERLSRILESGGDGADEWIVIAKGRGRQRHAGGSQLVEGQPADACLLGWVSSASGEAFETACQDGSIVAPPSEDW